jgi:RNA polymerase primary sigma factor
MRQIVISKQITDRSDNTINRYFQEISKYGLISSEEEVELSGRIRNGDQNALDRLVMANLRFVISVAKQYQNQGLALSDLINEGNHGLVKAALRFDETRGFKFISYAVWWIRQSIIQAISNNTRTVRLPMNKRAIINKISKAFPYLEQTFEREPTDEEVAEYLGINIKEVATSNILKRKQIYLDMPISHDGSSNATLYDVIIYEDTPMPDHHLLSDSVSMDIERILSKIPLREAQIIIMSYGLNNTPVRSLREMAENFNMSAERIRQIRSRALKSIRNLIEGNYLKD